MALNLIPKWPEGFQDRIEHVWRDLIGFTPNYKLYDLQQMLAKFGFTMVVYEGAASGAEAARPQMQAKPRGNVGHGHVFPRPDGGKAKCGGPSICSECARDESQKMD